MDQKSYWSVQIKQEYDSYRKVLLAKSANLAAQEYYASLTPALKRVVLSRGLKVSWLALDGGTESVDYAVVPEEIVEVPA